MLYPDIREIYKYYPPEDNRINCVVNKQLYFANPESFNDPFDGKINIVFDGDVNKYVFDYVNEKKIDISKYKSIEELINLKMLDKNGRLKKEIRDDYITRARYWINILEKTAISSFTSENDSILMWSHYAKNNAGFCIGYKRIGFLGNDRFCFPVNYSDFYPTIHVVDFLRDNRSFMTYFGTKSLKWSYEKEWRAISQDSGLSKNLGLFVTKIILGMRCDQKIETELTKYASRNKITVYKAYCAKNDYRIKLKKFLF